MELQLGSSRVDFLVKAHSTHNVKWVLTAIGCTHFREEFAWSGWIVSSTVFQSFCSCSSAPQSSLFQFAESLHLQFCYLIWKFSVFWTHTILLTVHTSLKELNNHWWLSQQAQSELQSTQRVHTSAKASQFSIFLILLIENFEKFVMLNFEGHLKPVWVRVKTYIRALCKDSDSQTLSYNMWSIYVRCELYFAMLL